MRIKAEGVDNTAHLLTLAQYTQQWKGGEQPTWWAPPPSTLPSAPPKPLAKPPPPPPLPVAG